MDPEFGAWYRAVELEPNHDRLTKRWSAIEKVCKACTAESVLEISRLFNGQSAKSKEWLGEYQGRFLDEDSAFDSSAHSAELVVLSGAVLANLASTGSKWAEMAASCVAVGSFGVPAHKVRLRPVRDRLSQYLRQRAEDARKPPVKRVSDKNRPKRLDAIHTALQAGHAQAADPLKAFLSELLADIDDCDSKLQVSERIRQESSGILWWAVSEYSEMLQIPIREIAVGALPFVLGAELANLTLIMPGLPNARSFVSHGMSLAQTALGPSTIQDWLVGMPRTERQLIAVKTKGDDAGELLPLLGALGRSLTFADDTVWKQDAAKRGESSDAPVSAIEIAEQVYLERMLARCVDSNS